jgi:lipoprotein-anchoring transpeptidase ErfK/SrfK
VIYTGLSLRKSMRFVFVMLLGLLLFAVVAPAPVEAAVEAAAGKRIIVSLGRQQLYAYSGNRLVASMSVNARGTRTGTFRVQNKIPAASSYVRGWTLPYWLGIYYVGRIQNGIHGPEMLRGGGTAVSSLGCVVIRSRANAAWLYAWAPVGTPVTVRR